MDVILNSYLFILTLKNVKNLCVFVRVVPVASVATLPSMCQCLFVQFSVNPTLNTKNKKIHLAWSWQSHYLLWMCCFSLEQETYLVFSSLISRAPLTSCLLPKNKTTQSSGMSLALNIFWTSSRTSFNLSTSLLSITKIIPFAVR